MNNYFFPDELQCPCCKQTVLAPGFLDHLNALREAVGHAMKINSCCRCLAHNRKIGGRDASFHLINVPEITKLHGACAADVSTVGWDGAKKWRFKKIAMGMGWSIGNAKTFIHIDKRAAYIETGWPNPVDFNY